MLSLCRGAWLWPVSATSGAASPPGATCVLCVAPFSLVVDSLCRQFHLSTGFLPRDAIGSSQVGMLGPGGLGVGKGSRLPGGTGQREDPALLPFPSLV